MLSLTKRKIYHIPSLSLLPMVNSYQSDDGCTIAVPKKSTVFHVPGALTLQPDDALDPKLKVVIHDNLIG